MATITPMMQQYIDMKKIYDDSLLFFRLGDFYEMFFEDALTASRELEITLTGRDCGLAEKAPMCGVPYHAADGYINRLIQKGYKVAIAEQMEDPSMAKGLVKRDVVRIVTPGTVTNAALLDEKKNNYLMCVIKMNSTYGLAVVDVTTGEMRTTSITWGNADVKLLDEISCYSPSEICCNQELLENAQLIGQIKDRFGIYFSVLDDEVLSAQSANMMLKKYFSHPADSLDKEMPGYIASGGLLSYIEKTQKLSLNHISELLEYKIDSFLTIDSSSRRNLEITETLREKKKKGSLLWVIDRTQTSMGGRLIRKWIDQPLIDVNAIKERLDAVAELHQKFMVRSEIRETLKGVYDLERLMGKVVYGSINARDMIALKVSLYALPGIANLMKDCESELLSALYKDMDLLDDIGGLIEASISDEPPAGVKDGDIIKSGYNNDVDKYRSASKDGKNWIAQLEAKEREITGIKNLKISYNRVFGYYIEVTKSYLNLVPETYVRKQTLANAERYITQDLKEIEDTILGAQEKLIEIEYQLFMQIRETLLNHIERIKNTACIISRLDALASFAETADRENYCRPVVDHDSIIDIKGGRHAVVEKMLKDTAFIPNDTYLDLNEDRLSIITGPNMAGKSTYMRQIALICILAQAGCFVPAEQARIGIVDKVFTRIGASDDLASGQSTFMVEMNEVANILSNATTRSLLILDEVGRGTSTYDGLSIAWAVLEYIMDSKRLGSRALFATHYHELTELEGRLSGVKNYCIDVREDGEDIVFLRKIKRGGADGSYGVQVARLAGLPQAIINRANEILIELDHADINKKSVHWKKATKTLEGQYDLFSMVAAEKGNGELIHDIQSLDLKNMTPMNALEALYNLQQKVKNL